jgi:hypothetical protein
MMTGSANPKYLWITICPGATVSTDHARIELGPKWREAEN